MHPHISRRRSASLTWSKSGWGGWGGWGVVASLLADHVRRRLVGAQPAPRRVTQSALARPLGEDDLADELRSHPVRVACVRPWHLVRERRRSPLERLEPRGELVEQPLREAGADVTGEEQSRVAIRYAEQQ